MKKELFNGTVFEKKHAGIINMIFQIILVFLLIATIIILLYFLYLNIPGEEEKLNLVLKNKADVFSEKVGEMFKCKYGYLPKFYKVEISKGAHIVN